MRPIRYIFIHCTATPAGREVTAADIRRWHTSPAPAGRGWKHSGYHYLIRLDGTIEPVEPEEVVANGVKGYNRCGLHVVYAGGLNVKGYAMDTRTPEQRDSLRRLVSRLKQKYPFAIVKGHNEVALKSCPCFNVQKDL